MKKKEEGLRRRSMFIISLLVALATALFSHYQDGYPWLNCIFLGLGVGFLCLVVLVTALPMRTG